MIALSAKIKAVTLLSLFAFSSLVTNGFAGQALHTGTAPTAPNPKRCIVIAGKLEPGTTLQLKKFQSTDRHQNLCLEFSGGDPTEAFKLVDYVLNEPFATYVRPHKKCGDLCSIVLLAGGTLEEGHWRDVSISRTADVIYRRLEPDFSTLSAITVGQAKAILGLIQFIDVETEYLNHTFFDEVFFGDTENSRVFPTKLLMKLKNLNGKDEFRMPTVVSVGDKFSRKNEYGIKIY